MELLYKIFVSKEQREFNKLVETTELMMDEVEQKNQIRGINKLLHRLKYLAMGEDNLETVENLNARREALVLFFEDE